MLIRSLLLFDILPDDGDRGAAAGSGEVARAPEDVLIIPGGDLRVATPQDPGGSALEAVHQGGDSDLGRVMDQEINMVVLAVHLDQLRLEVGADL